jgi:hypothetical protein
VSTCDPETWFSVLVLFRGREQHHGPHLDGVLPDVSFVSAKRVLE